MCVLAIYGPKLFEDLKLPQVRIEVHSTDFNKQLVRIF